MSTKIEIGPYTAYAIAVKYGYKGTEEEWIKEVEADRTRAETAAGKAEKAAARAVAAATVVWAYDVTLSTSGWTTTNDADARAAGMAYQCDAAIADCTDHMEPNSTVSLISVPIAQKAGLGSICCTGNGYCRFYAAYVPTGAINLRVLLIDRAE